MTTNSYGSALPRFDFEPLRPAVARAGIARALPLTTGIYAVPILAAAGIAIYAQTQVTKRNASIASSASATSHSIHKSKPNHPENLYRNHDFWENLEIACGVWS